METITFVFFIVIFALTIFDIILLLLYHFIIKKIEDEEDDDISYITDLLSTICVLGWFIIFYYIFC